MVGVVRRQLKRTKEDTTLPHGMWMGHLHRTVAEVDLGGRHGEGGMEGDGDRVTTLPFTHGTDAKKQQWRKRQRHAWKGGHGHDTRVERNGKKQDGWIHRRTKREKISSNNAGKGKGRETTIIDKKAKRRLTRRKRGEKQPTLVSDAIDKLLH